MLEKIKFIITVKHKEKLENNESHKLSAEIESWSEVIQERELL